MSRPCLVIAILVLFGAACNPEKPTERVRAPETDPLLGKWVCVADNGGGFKGSILDFRKDGTLQFNPVKGAPVSTHYKREPGKDWISKRVTDPKQLESPAMAMWTKPGVEVVFFADQSGQFPEGNPPRLILDPKSRTLGFPLTESWCRPGEEANYRQQTGADERDAQEKQREQDLNSWKPEKDVTSKWHETWSTTLSSPDRFICSIAVGDMDGDGTPEVIVPDAEGFVVLDKRGKTVRKVATPDEPGRYLVVGRRAGRGLVCEFKTWADLLSAFDATGRLAWTFKPGGMKGIEWISAVDIDAANTGFVMSYTGGGIEFIGPDGKSRWKAPVDSNVWNVAGARLGQGSAGVALAPGPDGVLVFDVAGKNLSTISAQGGEDVGAADLDGDGTDEILSLGTTSASGGNVTVFSADGKKKWSQKASGVEVAVVRGVPFVCGSFGGKRLLGVGSGMAVRFFEPTGKLFGDFLNRDGIVSIASLPLTRTTAALLVRHESGVRCYELKP